MALMLAGGAGAGRLDVVCGPGDRLWVHGCVSRMGLESDAGSYLRLKYSCGGGERWHPELQVGPVRLTGCPPLTLEFPTVHHGGSFLPPTRPASVLWVEVRVFPVKPLASPGW